MNDTLHTVKSVHENVIRITAVQWTYVTEAHDYMAGNMDKVLETLAEPDKGIEGKQSPAHL